MTTTVRTPQHVEQDLTNKPTEKTPYELACESGFLGSLSTNGNVVDEGEKRVKEIIACKHRQAKEH